MKLCQSAGKWFCWLLFISALVRALLAASVCLTNDEAYYYTYALYPDLSHFDHPPMVGWIIQIFTLNLHFSHEFFIRLGAVVAGTVNTFLIYRIGNLLGGKQAGFAAAVLYTASLYGFIIAGTMMMPDSAQSVFWLAAVLLLLKVLPGDPSAGNNNRHLLGAAVLVGLAMLSKYTSTFLWAGAMAYVLLYNRKWLKKKEFWFSQLIIILLFTPVIIWNARNQFISFTFHESRVGIGNTGIQWMDLLTEIGGELLYNNPLNVVITFIAVFTLIFAGKNEMKSEHKLLVLIALPLILMFIFISAFRPTLPHWSGMGYVTLIPIAAWWLVKKANYVKIIITAFLLNLALIALAVLQIGTGFIDAKIFSPAKGKNQPAFDYSLEVYGWRQFQKQIVPIFGKYESAGIMPADAPLVSYRWFPAGNYEYYATRGTPHPVLAAGDTAEIHKYLWINQIHGGFRLNSDAWYITSDLDYRHPSALKGLYYRTIMPPDTITIYRMGKPAYCFYVYRLMDLQSKR